MANTYIYNDLTGVIITDTSDILTEVQGEYQSAFNNTNLSVDPSTPQGVLIATDTLARSQLINNNAAIANQINPNLAGGVFLDVLLALSGIQRTPATQSFVANVTLTGAAGTVIQQGTLAQTAVGDQFYSASAVTLGVSGAATVNFYSVAYGAIPCAVSALNTIVSAVLGLETINNTIAAVLGNSTQSDISARAYRSNTLAFQAVSLPFATISALYNVAGVTSVFYQENTASTTQTINGISMAARSVYACVYGGAENAIAAALLENKSSGAAWNGGTSVTVTEPASGQNYTVLFDVATPVGILVQVTTTNGNSININQAVLDYFSGLGIGASVSAFDIAAQIIAENPTYYIKLVQISLESSISYSSNEILVPVNEIAYSKTNWITTIIAAS